MPRMHTWLAGLQVAMVVAFTVILGVLDPWLLVHPFGVLTKNLPLLAVVGCAWFLWQEGWSPRAHWLLRIGVAVIWLTEGLFPKILFQQPLELEMVAAAAPAVGLPVEPSHFLVAMGLAQIASGLGVLLLRGRALKLLLLLQAAALVGRRVEHLAPLADGVAPPRHAAVEPVRRDRQPDQADDHPAQVPRQQPRRVCRGHAGRGRPAVLELGQVQL